MVQNLELLPDVILRIQESRFYSDLSLFWGGKINITNVFRPDSYAGG